MAQEYILVSVAWPYANADIHQGNVTGSYLPADIYARFHRLQGNHVLMVSGTDSHGTPVTVKAEKVGKTAEELFQFYHARFLELFQQLGLSYDLYTHTDTENHHQVSQSPHFYVRFALWQLFGQSPLYAQECESCRQLSAHP